MNAWILVVLLIAGCSTIQPWKPGQKAGFNFVISDKDGCQEKLVVNSKIRYTKCF